jgi:hypothetical protein
MTQSVWFSHNKKFQRKLGKKSKISSSYTLRCPLSETFIFSTQTLKLRENSSFQKILFFFVSFLFCVLYVVVFILHFRLTKIVRFSRLQSRSQKWKDSQKIWKRHGMCTFRIERELVVWKKKTFFSVRFFCT